MMGWGGYGYSRLWGLLMVLFWVLDVAGIALLALWLIRRERPPRGGEEGRDDRALAILRERYARGEITQQQYEQMRRDLE